MFETIIGALPAPTLTVSTPDTPVKLNVLGVTVEVKSPRDFDNFYVATYYLRAETLVKNCHPSLR